MFQSGVCHTDDRDGRCEIDAGSVCTCLLPGLLVVAVLLEEVVQQQTNMTPKDSVKWLCLVGRVNHWLLGKLRVLTAMGLYSNLS